MRQAKDYIIVALDVNDIEKAYRLVVDLRPHVGMFKVGLELIWVIVGALLKGTSSEKETVVKLFDALGRDFFLDPKLKDIPHTLKNALAAIQRLSPRFVTVYADAGREGIRAAVEARGETDILGVTVLTSFDEKSCKEVYESTSRKKKVVKYKVLQFADMLYDCGAQGIVCSAQEVGILRGYERFNEMFMVVPGARSVWASANDQKRVRTLEDAILSGADYLVIGRQITNPPPEVGDSIKAAKMSAEEIGSGLAKRRRAYVV